MNSVDDATYPAFKEYWLEQFNVYDIYIRLTPQPKGYIAWAANRTMLETCIDKAGIEGTIDYNAMPHYPINWFEPATGETALETAKAAVEIYTQAIMNPEKRTLMNVGCVAIAELLTKE